MKRTILVVSILALGAGVGLYTTRTHASPSSFQSSAAIASGARFTSDGKLMRPAGYRRWAYVSTGFGMSYNPDAGGNGNPAFTNVFVTPDAYDYFQNHGTWPDKTMFVLEIYGSTSHGSINQHGSYQESLVGLDVEVKDETRFADKWAYFGFGNTEETAAATAPAKNACWKCHDQSAAVEHSFVQFYPELLKIARAKGTLKPGVDTGEKK